MSNPAQPAHSFVGRWIASWSVPAAAQIALSMWFATGVEFGSPMLLFWVVVIAASLCLVTSAAVIMRSFDRNEADLGFLGLFFCAVSALPLVHGITTPGVIVGDNTSTMTSVLLSIPIGLTAAGPALVPAFRQARWVRRHWRVWIATWLGVISALAAALLIDVDLLPAPTLRQPLTIAVAVVSFVGCVVLSRRHLLLACVAERSSPLVVSLGYGLVGSSAFVWLSTAPYSSGFWSAHAFDVIGVLGATIGAIVVYGRTGRVSEVLAPVLVVDPLGALEIGLDPIVHRFVADLEAKDPITRDHVVRTAEIAVRVGEELRVGPTALRCVGLTAILHDVGKLDVPDEILNKPGRLTDEEFEVMRRHTVDGERLVAGSLVLAGIAAGVRAHHERMDGDGYPDGLVGDAIPHAARVVAVCDAFDAMTHTRQYRDGMGRDTAMAVLNEHAGSQWDPVVVAALAAIVRTDPRISEAGRTLDLIGRGLAHAGPAQRIGCDCLPEPLIGEASVLPVDRSGSVDAIDGEPSLVLTPAAVWDPPNPDAVVVPGAH
ncbi:MAG: HD domain-containing phosphohydrolase [Ilumatobacter sp.]|uniref:HD-GYP domain-containing protein n=3 Tax=Ilumatobacter sp. TaxID=1967498 RepID=UPI00329A13F8